MRRIAGASFLSLLGLLLVLGAFGSREPAEAGPFGPTGLERALQAQESHTDALLSQAGIVGTALGLDDDGNAIVQVFTTHAGVGGIPSTLDGVEVQVVVTGEMVARSTPIGSSASNEFSIDFPFCSTGTLGGRLVSSDGTGFGLSNNHVFANVNGANGAGPGSAIVSPGLADSGCTTSGTQTLGTLYSYVPIKFDGTANLVDAAIALDASGAIGISTPGGKYTPSSIALTCVDAACGNLLGRSVQKYGRTTALTAGTITGVNATVDVNYGKGKKARFVDQLVAGAGFSDSGDSGSLVVTNDANANPIGLLFAGGSSTTVLNRIDLVYSELASGTVVGNAVSGLHTDGPAVQPDSGTPAPTSTPSASTPTPTPVPATPTPVPSGAVTVSGIVTATGNPVVLNAGSTLNGVVISGSGFAQGATVTFQNGSGPAPVAVVTSTSGTEVTISLSVKSGGPPGSRFWQPVVTNPNGDSGVCSCTIEVVR